MVQLCQTEGQFEGSGSFLKGVKPRFLPGNRQSFLRPLEDTLWILDHSPLICL
jgi:hypothetical protein